ncbi:protein-serine/threonineeeee kinase [Sporothrix schenckii 1099-18]|uniref:non-specific serine/threonine protein kinase n=2 Tax=Sporothrix schenckii TaxID=29908 RepID=U7Q586_SPOS1|nr:protein-serine/threonineeeee kinase [Sporothrix schenckii 1099-18]ERT03044.1 AGC/AKT protein kinase [Sporothrix schenckii ATCC 58251]KJR84560.1 protein-serine/threonineeeee kinase [Sporothrix schenckii 1099-18]
MTPTNGIDESSRSAAADDDGTDQIGSDTPRSGVATPQPDLHDKRLPGIMSYFNQVRPASFKRLLSGNFTLPSRPSSASSNTPSTASTSTANFAIPATTPNSTSAPAYASAPKAAEDVLPSMTPSQTQPQRPPSPTTNLPQPEDSITISIVTAAPPKSRPRPSLSKTTNASYSRNTETSPSIRGDAMTQQHSKTELEESQSKSHSESWQLDEPHPEPLPNPPPLQQPQPPREQTAPTGDESLPSESLAAAAHSSLHPYPTPPASIRGAVGTGSGGSGGGAAGVAKEGTEAVSTKNGAGAPGAAGSTISNPWDVPWTFRSHKKSVSDVLEARGRQESSSSTTPLTGVVTPSSVLARHFSIPSIPSLATPSSTSTSSNTPASTRSPSVTPGGPRASTAPDTPAGVGSPVADASAPAAVLRSASVSQLKKLTMTRLKSGQSTPTRSLSAAQSHATESHASPAPTSVNESTATTMSRDGDDSSRSRAASITPTSQGAQAPAPKGKLTIKITEARGLRRTRDPYVVAVFQRSELISGGPRSPDDGEDAVLPGVAISSIPIQRQASDSGRPMAIPMRSRQSSNTSITDYGAFRNRTVRRSLTNPKWDAEAVFDVVDSNMLVDISVYDHVQSGEEFLGHVDFQANSSEKEGPVRGWFPLRGHADTIAENIPTGEVYVEAFYQRTERKHYGPDDFEILRLIGKGTFGQVYQVRKKDTHRIYAMKVLSKKKIVQKKEVAHTVGERNILVRTATSDSPFIVGLKFSFQTPSDLYLVTDYMSGGELFWHLQKEGRFEEGRAKFYIAELILAIEHLHNNNIVYRDLKPENILLDANGHIALCDFGLSKANLTKNDTTNTFCGTTEYLAPEVLLDEAGYTKMVDFWSLGVLVFEMCCGWSPFYAEDTQQMYKNIAFGKVRFPKDTLSAEGRSFVKGLLNRNPKHRLGATKDAAELMEHPFFRDIDWDALSKKLITPPFKPKLKSDTDVSYFDPIFTDAMDKSGSLNERAAALARGIATSTPLSPSMQANFQGFTFVDESALEDNMRGRPSYNNDDFDDDMHDAGNSYHNSHGGHKDDEWDDINDIDPRNANRMSGIVRTTTNDEHMFGDTHFDM